MYLWGIWSGGIEKNSKMYSFVNYSHIFSYVARKTKISRDRAVAAHRVHNPEVGGSNPPPATQ